MNNNLVNEFLEDIPMSIVRKAGLDLVILRDTGVFPPKCDFMATVATMCEKLEFLSRNDAKNILTQFVLYKCLHEYVCMYND